jgi:hypothetical protein
VSVRDQPSGWWQRWRRSARSQLLWSLAAGLAAVVALFVVVAVAQVPSASASVSAPSVAQCDPPAYPTGAGYQVTCTLEIVNTVTAAGATSSTITATACLAAAGVLPPSGCTTTVSRSDRLVTSVNQCNGIVDGGGSNVKCTVTVDNTIPSGHPTTDVTVDQCIGSGTGGGTAPTVKCAPIGSTTNATVTQCNGSGNGGGASLRVECNVTGKVAALPVTISQCNDAGNGGGSTVICATTFTNTFVSTSPTTTTTLPTTTTTLPRTTTTTAPTTTLPRTTTTTAPATTSTSPTATTVASTTSSTTAVTVPRAHTGKPWAGWPWWAGTAVVGLTGVGLIEPWRRRAGKSR